ncbi:hypothetical protein D3C87_1140260 [compost metagenome]
MRAFGIEELVVVQTVVMFVIIARWKQAAEAQLFAHRRLGIAAHAEQCLEAVAVVLGGAHRAGERFAAGLGDQLGCAVGGARWRHLGLQGHAGDAAHQCGVAFERFAGQRSFGLELGHQFIQQTFDPSDVALQLIILDVTLHQHHARHAVFERLLWQEGVGQQVAILLIATRDVAGRLDQIGQAAFVAQQRLIGGGQFVQRVDCPAFDLHGFEGDFGAHHQRLGLGRAGFRDLQWRGRRTISVGGQVRHGQVADGFIAVEKTGQGVGEEGGAEGQ